MNTSLPFRMLTGLALALTLALALSLPAFAIDPQNFASAEEEARYWALIEELRCLVCQNQNLADSNAVLAKDLRDQVLELMQSGKSDAEIKTYLTDRYGDFVLYNPPVKPSTWGLWFGPIVLIVIGAVGMTLHLRRRQQNPAAIAADPHQEDLDRELAALEAEREGQQ